MFWDGYQVHSSLVASKAQHDDMLTFAAHHKVKPAIQVFKHEGAQSVTDVFDKLSHGTVRYRAVLEF
jgi:D-arabinose 1-dehydrogenase-like Zn-dependent alcohol dehydrogenase